MKDLADFLVDLGVEFWICQACGEGRNVVPDNFLATAKYMTMDDYIKAVAEFDRSLSF